MFIKVWLFRRLWPKKISNMNVVKNTVFRWWNFLNMFYSNVFLSSGDSVHLAFKTSACTDFKKILFMSIFFLNDSILELSVKNVCVIIIFRSIWDEGPRRVVQTSEWSARLKPFSFGFCIRPQTGIYIFFYFIFIERRLIFFFHP